MFFLRKQDVLAIHAATLRLHGGSDGLRDEGGLESAIVAAENRFHYESADLVACAAAYAFHLSQAHAFVDGNKRVAAGATEVFVIQNGGRIDASDDEMVELFLGIADGSFSRDAVEAWLRSRIVAGLVGMSG
jgi:death-on-curing protein